MKKGVNVNLNVDFGVVRETLSRMGIVNKDERVITPTCYIYYEDNEYYICHFKELLALSDGSSDILDEKDTNRRNAICTLLENWGLIEIIYTGVFQEFLLEKIFVLTAKEKREDQYTTNHKFNSFNSLAEARALEKRSKHVDE